MYQEQTTEEKALCIWLLVIILGLDIHCVHCVSYM